MDAIDYLTSLQYWNDIVKIIWWLFPINGQVACGAEFSMILDKRGYLYSFGCPEYGQLGHNTDGKYFVTSNKLSYQFETSARRIPVFVECTKGGHPRPVPDVQIVDVACGNNHTVSAAVL